MESASPEPSRHRGLTPTPGTAAQGPAAPGTHTGGDLPGEGERSEPVGGDLPGEGERSEPVGGEFIVRVVDDQADPVDLAHIAALARHTLAALDVPVELELSITCVDLRRMTDLNEAHLGGAGPTDVLAFPIDGVEDAIDDVPGLLGDVVICPRVAIQQAGDHGRTASAELDLLVVHGILHLLGHDHAADDDRARMFGLTDDLLAGFAGRGAGR